MFYFLVSGQKFTGLFSPKAGGIAVEHFSYFDFCRKYYDTIGLRYEWRV